MLTWIGRIVRVIATVLPPDFDEPWAFRHPETTRTAALLFAPRKLLCSANAITFARHLEIEVPGTARRGIARVAAVSHDRDLALLEVTDGGEAFDHAPPIELAPLPDLGDEIAVAGAANGDSASVLEGIVSKIDAVRYTHSQREMLTVAVDVNQDELDGVGPAFAGDRLAGILVQKPKEGRVGELVPAPIVRAFLDAVRDGHGTEVPALGFATQNLHNAALRRHVGRADDGVGVLVIHVDHGGSADGTLRPGDVVTAIDGATVESSGHVSYLGHAIKLHAIVGDRRIGDRMRIAFTREGASHTAELTLLPWRPLVPRAEHTSTPRYFVWGGLFVLPLTRDYLTTWEEWWNKAPKELLNLYYLGKRTAAQQEMVVLTRILADELTTGYDHLYNEVIATVNGVVPRDFAALVEQLDRATGTVRIETTSGGVIILDAAEVAARNDEILERYGIPSDRYPR